MRRLSPLAWVGLCFAVACGGGDGSEPATDPCESLPGLMLPAAEGYAGELPNIGAQSLFFHDQRGILGMPALRAAGVATADLNGDGRPEIISGGDGRQGPAGSPALWTSCADGSWRTLDLRALALPGSDELPLQLRSTAAAVFDADADGDLDLFTAYFDTSVHYWENRAESGQSLRFARRRIWFSAQVDDRPQMVTALRPVDFDADGQFELYIARNQTNAINEPAAPENLVFARSDASWLDVTGDYPGIIELGRRATFDAAFIPGPPGWENDLFWIVNDFGPDGVFLHRVVGGQAVFQELTLPSLPPPTPYTSGMGIDWLTDGESVFVVITDVGRKVLYRITRDGAAFDVSPASFTDTFPAHVYWGVVMSRDFDNDSRRDMAIMAAPFSADPSITARFRDQNPNLVTREFPSLLRNRGDSELDFELADLSGDAGPFFDAERSFQDATLERNYASFHPVDLKGDGCLDGVVTPFPLPLTQPPWAVFTNEVVVAANDHCNPDADWIGFDIADPYAIVELRFGGERRFLGSAITTGPFGYGLGRRHIGLGAAGESPLTATVRWPDGRERVLEALAPRQYHAVAAP